MSEADFMLILRHRVSSVTEEVKKKTLLFVAKDFILRAEAPKQLMAEKSSCTGDKSV